MIQQCHSVCMKILRAYAKCLQISKENTDYFVARHKFELESGDVLRFLHYPLIPANDEELTIRTGGYWLI
jgi:isopenicillin N synthase-like dioxygenase